MENAEVAITKNFFRILTMGLFIVAGIGLAILLIVIIVLMVGFVWHGVPMLWDMTSPIAHMVAR